MNISSELWLTCFYTLLASVAFGFMFNIRGAEVFAAAFGGVICAFLNGFMNANGISELLRCFIASGAVTVYSEILARRLKSPVPTFLIVSIIPLVPGGYIYYAMTACINGDLLDFGRRAVHTFGVAGAIALGIFTVTFALRCIKKIKKPLIKVIKIGDKS